MHRSVPPGDRRGFTLLELMLALTIGASLLLAGRAIFERVGETGRAAVRAAAEIDAERVKYAQLRTLLWNVEAGVDSNVRFDGDERYARFTSWCAGVPRGWIKCPVTITVDTDIVIDSGAGSQPVSSGRGARGVLRYLVDARYGGRWQATWRGAAGVPPAVAIVFRTDTAVLRTGPRE